MLSTGTPHSTGAGLNGGTGGQHVIDQQDRQRAHPTRMDLERLADVARAFVGRKPCRSSPVEQWPEFRA